MYLLFKMVEKHHATGMNNIELRNESRTEYSKLREYY